MDNDKKNTGTKFNLKNTKIDRREAGMTFFVFFIQKKKTAHITKKNSIKNNIFFSSVS
jgi:hypothetical protein